MTELVVRKGVPPIDWSGVPAGYVHRASVVCRTLKECEEIVRWFGDAAFCPYLPVLVKAPGGWTAITGWGYADAAELQDCAVTLWHRQTIAMEQNNGALMDFDTLREKHGLMRREDVEAAVAEAATARIAAHRASPVTDPFRQPRYPRWRGKTLHTTPESQAWKVTNGEPNPI